MTETASDGLTSYQRTRRAVLAILITALGLVLVFGASLQSETTHERIEWVGLVLIFAGIGGRLWSILYIGGRKSLEVVTGGPYSITRNPLYFFSSVAAGGAGAQMGSYIAAVGLALMCAIVFQIVIRREEDYLSDKMGATYLAYLDHVPRFVPNPFLYRDETEVTVRTRTLRLTFLDGLMFFTAIPFFELIEKAQMDGVIAVLFRLY